MDEVARALAEQFVPVIMIKEQEEDCDPDGEPFWPIRDASTSVLNAAVGIIGLLLALILLIVASSIPLWVFSILVSLVYAFVVPFAALAMTLLYGDAVAEQQGAERADPVPVG